MTAETRSEIPRNSLSSMASSTMMRTGSSDSQGDAQPMLSDSEAGTPRRPRGFLDRMLGRNGNGAGGHRSSASMSVLIPSLISPSTLPSTEQRASPNPTPSTSPIARSRPSLVLQSTTTSFKTTTTSDPSSAITPTASSPEHSRSSLNLNTLSNTERTERVKRNRKLVQLLGHEISATDALLTPDAFAPPMHLRNAFVHSTNNISPLSQTEFDSLGSKQQRRHSSPISPSFEREAFLSPRVLRRNLFNSPNTFQNGGEDASTSSGGESGDDEDWPVQRRFLGPSRSVHEPPHSAPPPGASSSSHSLSRSHPSERSSGVPPSSSPAPGSEKVADANERRTLAHAPSIASIITVVSNYDGDMIEDDGTPKSPEDLERARKRATLAKLHRFLGSRVPPELVLPLSNGEGEALFAEAGNDFGVQSAISLGSTTKRSSMLRKRTKSKTTGPSPLASRDNINEADADSPLRSPVKTKHQRKHTMTNASLLRPQSHVPIAYLSDGELDTKGSTLTGAQRVHIMRKQKKIAKMLGACPPGTMKHQSDFLMKGEFDGDETQFGFLPQEPGRSKQYTQHRYSINSLTYLVKTNDQEQLQDLLTYMRNDDDGSSLRQRSRQGSAASLRPSRASTSSSTNPQSSSNSNSKLRDLSSESTLTDHAETMEEGASSIEAPTVPFLDKGDLPPIPPSPTDSFSFLTSQSSRGAEDLKADAFQQRRKRAEKLSSFFGVDYRELFTEVLDVIESEVRSDSIHGNLSPEETQDLLIKLRKLKKT